MEFTDSAGKATPAPPVGLHGQHGVNIVSYQNGSMLEQQTGDLIILLLSRFTMTGFSFVTKVATITKAQVQEIAETKCLT